MQELPRCLNWLWNILGYPRYRIDGGPWTYCRLPKEHEK